MYDPQEYWETRLSNRFSLRGVGHQSYSLFYNHWLYLRKKQLLQRIFKNKNLKEKSILDIGAGTGFFIDWYLKKEAQVTGLDISATAVRKLKLKYPEATFTKADFTQPKPLPVEHFDIISAWDVIYHQTDDDHFQHFLMNCAAYCKVGGYFICSDGFGLKNQVTPAVHVKIRNRNDYFELMPNLGFEILHEFPLYKFLNRSVKQSRLQRHIYQALAPVWWFLDQFQTKPAKNNLSVSVWIKKQESELL